MVDSWGLVAVDGWWDATENTDDVLSLDRALEGRYNSGLEDMSDMDGLGGLGGLGGLSGGHRRVLRPNSRSRPGRPRLWREGESSMADWCGTSVQS